MSKAKDTINIVNTGLRAMDAIQRVAKKVATKKKDVVILQPNEARLRENRDFQDLAKAVWHLAKILEKNHACDGSPCTAHKNQRAAMDNLERMFKFE